MSYGLPYEVIPELEQSEFNDWAAASRALDIDKKIKAINISLSPHRKPTDLMGELNKLKNEQMLLLGDNPFRADEAAIKGSRERLKKQGKVTRRNGDDNKRNPRKIKT